MKRLPRLFVFAVVLLTFATPSSNAQTFSVLYNFGSAAGDPYNPSYSGIVTQGTDGNLYSTAPHGGAHACGAVFKITPARKLTIVYSFACSSDGGFPQGGVTLGRDGNFYGTTYEDGDGSPFPAGTVFQVTPSGSLKTLYNFGDGKDGGYPFAPPVEGNDGNFYGTTIDGGDTTHCGATGCGTIYKITPSGVLTTLHRFVITDGNEPYAPLVLGTDGNFYGTTEYGGANSANSGVVFKITPAGLFRVLYSFDGTHGESPTAPLVEGSDGNFYGTTRNGGVGYGVVFKITPAGTLKVLRNLVGSTDGANPYAGLVQGTDGNFYGANAYGGTVNSKCSDGCGTLFKITPLGVYSVLYKFASLSEVSVTPFQHTSGVVYGDTIVGGTGKISPCTVGACGVFYRWHNTTLTPFVSLLPYSGKVEQTIEILGQGFVSGKTTVSFNGSAAKATVYSNTYLTAVVPKGATTGLITVTTSGVKLTSNKTFRVTP